MEFNIVKKIDKLIIDNQDELMSCLEEKIELIKENTKILKINPINLLDKFGINLYKCNNLEEQYKTFSKYDKNFQPSIYYNGAFELNEVRFYIMIEIIYCLMLDYIVSKYINEKELELLENRVFHTVEFNEINEFLSNNYFVDKNIRDLAFKAMLPSNIFEDFDKKNISIKELSKYFEVDDRIIDYYLKQNQKEKRKLLRRKYN